MLRPPAPIPATSWLPACFPLFMVVNLLHALPRPDPRYPTEGRSRIHQALRMIQILAPRDAFEAELVLQVIITGQHVPLLYTLASMHQSDLKAFMRYQRMVMATARTSGAIETRLLRRQRALDGRPGEADVPWEHDLAELEAIWREGVAVEGEVAAEVVVEAPGLADAELAQVAEVEAPMATAEPAAPALSRQPRRALERMQQKQARRMEVRGLARAA